MWRRPATTLILILALIAAAALLAACSGDDPAKPGDTDTTAPRVVATGPSAGEVSVGVNDSIFVMFSEAMDPDSAEGSVTLSSGTVTGYAWYDDNVLALGHTAWTEATEVTVTCGAGLADVAGNALEPASFSFWTETSELLLLDTVPADGATGINRDTSILLVFSQDVQQASLESHVIISDLIAKAVFPYDVSRLDYGHYLLNPTSTLPATTTIAVAVNAGLAASGGATLAANSGFTFTTGTAVDTTPPTVVLAEPANGSTSVPPDQGYLSLTFSEPIDPDTIEPSRWNLAFYFAFMGYGGGGFWNEDHTVLTVALPPGLPAGMPIELTFVGFRDLAGNEQTTPYTYSVKIQGTADYLPWADGNRYREEVGYQYGTIGNPTPEGDGYYDRSLVIDKVSTSDYRFVEYDGSYTTPTGSWEQFRKTGSAVQWVAFEDSKSTKSLLRLPRGADKSIAFDTPLTILPLPLAVGNWTSSTTVTVPGEGDYTAALTGRVLGKENLPIAGTGGWIFVKDAWKVVRTMAVTLDGSPAFTETDTVWYAPTLGEVHRKGYETDTMANEWYEDESWRYPYIEMMSKLAKPSF